MPLSFPAGPMERLADRADRADRAGHPAAKEPGRAAKSFRVRRGFLGATIASDLRGHGYPNMRHDSETLDLKQTLGILRRRLPVIVLCVVVVAGAAYAFSKREAKKYTATASVVFNNSPQTQEIAGLPIGGSGVSLLAEQASELELVKTGDMATRTANLLGHGLTPQQVGENVSVAGQGESGVVDVSATAGSPELAAKIANAYVRVFVEEQKTANLKYYKSVLALVRRQLAALTPKQREGSDGLDLENRAQTLSILTELKQGNVQVAQEAAVPLSASSPKTSRNVTIGGVLGLFIGLALAFILEPINRLIRTAEDLEAIYRLPLLGSVPKSRALARKGAPLPPVEAEAFSLIRAHLRLFNSGRELRTIVITSAAVGDGKTTIARRLAEVAARSGSRVLLLELDLRQPTLAGQLDIQAGPGVADVLMGTVSMEEATRSVNVGTTSPSERAAERTFDVLTAGTALPPSPGELLESHAMEGVLEQARSVYDLVIIDTPPLTCVSDGFSLLPRVDGVVVVGWVDHSRRDAAEQLQRILAASGAPQVGVIANGSKSAGGSGHYHPQAGGLSPVVVSANGASSAKDFIPAGKA
jgi:succinoglycan biosynthesis transport protein ExoP